jgi:ParB family transcriptional regulator, chromosome partitioning protein
VARRSGLGKGLGALIPTEVVTTRASALREVPITSIRPNPLQPRTHFDEESMASLASSIRELGVLQPILVRETTEGDFELIAGERRWRAARRAGLQTMPVLLQSASDVGSLEQALVENLHREDLNALEEAAAYQQLVDDFGYTHEQVASRVGKSRTSVTNTLRLLQLPAGVQRALADGVLSAGHARALLGTPDRSFQEDMAKKAVADALTVRALEEAVRRHVRDEPDRVVDNVTQIGVEPATQAPEPTPISVQSDTQRRRLAAPGVLELEELLSTHLNTRVKVDMGSKRGRVVVDFATLEDLERIYKLMVGSNSTLK